jgi:hypothetical protein
MKLPLRAKLKSKPRCRSKLPFSNRKKVSLEPSLRKPRTKLAYLKLKYTVKASNFGPHGNFGLFLASLVASVDESCTKK